VKRNRLLYGGLFLGVALSALLYGDALMFMTLYALVIMPLISLLFAFATLYGLRMKQQTAETTVVKGEAGRYVVTVHNSIYIGLGSIQCSFKEGNFAIETEATDRYIEIQPFMKPQQIHFNFTVKYWGIWQMGLDSIEMNDFLGLFRLRRKISQKFEIVAYPRITELEHMQLAVHLLSKAPANLVSAQEDYTDITDVRPYEPSDPIKKVHWKLTAKRGEWIVKNYQSSSLNSMAILVDSKKQTIYHEDRIKLEDTMIEHAVAVLRYCLRQQMPVDLLFGNHVRETGRHIGDFDPIYNVLANLSFTEEDFSVHDALVKYLNETSRNVNMVILTSKLDMPLYEQILNAVRFGHYIAVMYFEPKKMTRSSVSGAVFERLQSSGLNCVKM